MRRITYFFALLATLFMAGTQTASAIAVEAEVNTGIWYRIKFADSQMVVAAYDEEDDAFVLGQYVTEGTVLKLTEQFDCDGQLFRFVSMGAGEEAGFGRNLNNFYAIQNKATGLYIDTNGKLTKAPCYFVAFNEGEEMLSLSAFYYDYELSAYRSNGTFGQIEDFQVSVTTREPWDMRFYLVPYCDVEENFKPAPLIVTDESGQISFQCWPVELSTPKGMFKAVCIKNDGHGNKTLGLNTITSVGAGEPFVYIHGMGEKWSGQLLDAEFQIGNGISQAPVKVNGLVGTFVDAEAGYKYGFDDWDNMITTVYTIPAYSCYIDSELPTDEVDCDLELAIGDNPIPTAIDNTLEKVGKAGNVYDMSGRKVATGVTLNEVQGLPTGTYIFNGVKVGVK